MRAWEDLDSWDFILKARIERERPYKAEECYEVCLVPPLSRNLGRHVRYFYHKWLDIVSKFFCLFVFFCIIKNLFEPTLKNRDSCEMEF